jgi:hypothetical protein
VRVALGQQVAIVAPRDCPVATVWRGVPTLASNQSSSAIWSRSALWTW